MRIKITLFIFVILGVGIASYSWILVSLTADSSLYRNIDELPSYDVGLLLGTSPSSNGIQNIFFSTRIEAAKALYERGKIRRILVSGDNATPLYNEPEAMRRALVKAGIPDEAIILDSAGFRTLDSVVRASQVFCQDSGFIIISQPFHVERALYLAKVNHISAIGYGSANVSLKRGLRTYLREILARPIAIYDGFIGTDPKFLGKRLCIEL